MEENQTAESLGDLLDHEYDGIREYDNPCPGPPTSLSRGSASLKRRCALLGYVSCAPDTLSNALAILPRGLTHNLASAGDYCSRWLERSPPGPRQRCDASLSVHVVIDSAGSSISTNCLASLRLVLDSTKPYRNASSGQTRKQRAQL